MYNQFAQLSPGSGGGGAKRSPFSISGNGVYFGPKYVPERIQVGKQRELVRHANFCGLEDIFEIYGKNREVHVSGKLRQSELQAFENVLDHNQTADLITPGWSGQIRVVEGEYEGPVAWDAMSDEYLWSYTLDVVSTGLDEAGHLRYYNKGIVSDGRSDTSTSSPITSLTPEQRKLLSGVE